MQTSRNWIAVLGLLAALGSTGCSQSETPSISKPEEEPPRWVTRPLPPEYRKILEDPSGWTKIASLANLPASVVALNQPMSDFGQPWNPTDVVIDARLPFRRLIWAANKGNVYVIYYEHGGIGTGLDIAVTVFPDVNGTAVNVWDAYTPLLKDPQEMAEMLAKNPGRFYDKQVRVPKTP